MKKKDSTIKWLFKEVPYVILIFLIVVIQILIIAFPNTPLLPLALILPWALLIATQLTPCNKFYSILPNRKNVSEIIYALDLWTFDYSGFKSVYMKFIYPEPLPELPNNAGSDEPPYYPFREYPWYYLIDKKHHSNLSLVSSYARDYSLRQFCIALELNNLLLRRSDFLDTSSTPSLYNTIGHGENLARYIENRSNTFKIASLFFYEPFQSYYAAYASRYDPKRVDYLGDFQYDVVNYIILCFSEQSEPRFKDFLEQTKVKYQNNLKASYKYKDSEIDEMKIKIKNLEELQSLV